MSAAGSNFGEETDVGGPELVAPDLDFSRTTFVESRSLSDNVRATSTQERRLMSTISLCIGEALKGHAILHTIARN